MGDPRVCFSEATSTTLAQRDVELKLLEFLQLYQPEVYALWASHPDANFDEHGGEKIQGDDESKSSSAGNLHLYRSVHERYVLLSLLGFKDAVERQYCVQPWIVFWVLHTAELLGFKEELYKNISPDALGEFLLACLQEEKADTSMSTKSSDTNVLKGEINNDDKKNDNTTQNTNCSETVFLQPSDKLLDDSNDDGKRLVGFAGGRLAQKPHLAASYAAVCALCMLGNPLHLRSIPRAAIKRWLLELREDDGSFRVHIGGEADVRASYCVAVLVTLLQLEDVVAYKDGRDEKILTRQAAEFVASCQTHEGGFSSASGASEAHGSYTLCGLASLLLMQQPHLCKYTSLRRWLASRQMKFEGGFNGRTNKLVDSCYSYWVGASHVLMGVGEAYARFFTQKGGAQSLTAREIMLLDQAQLIDVSSISLINEDDWYKAEETCQEQLGNVKAFMNTLSSPSTSSFFDEEVGDFLFNQRRQMLYILSCCQDKVMGGLKDKPECPNDTYHTCYALSGMSLAQNLQYMPTPPLSEGIIYKESISRGYIPGERDEYGVVLTLNDSNNDKKKEEKNQELLCPINPIFNIHRSGVLTALRLWGGKSFLC
ncbi:protein farnesyltransferase [Trypanosoma theileri]|uniref:Protein farnesyltransferase n=1 Tax=Trypanosoma theileri TaxID=67003 RepID=A0A1X0NSS5_9TRYP|nr:protein farnesyltransferase [Trypanosoma theileri]ORC87523.1 protein farnesyltransferase [Trypanosoma theileri]